MAQEQEKIGRLLRELLEKGNYLKGGVAVTSAGAGASVGCKLNDTKQSIRVQAGNQIKAGNQVLVAFSPDGKPLIAISSMPPQPGDKSEVEKSENRREPTKNKGKKGEAIVPILISKTKGDSLPEKPKCTCTHYAPAKPRGVRPFVYETCDGTTPGAQDGDGGQEGAEVELGIVKVRYWCFNAWGTNSTIPWINATPVCEEPAIPSDPNIAIYGGRSQDFKLDPLQPNDTPRTRLYGVANMFLVETAPISGYFGGFNPATTELFLYPEVQQSIWGFHLVADEQDVVTETGRKFEVKPSTIREIPTLTSPVIAVATAKAWYHQGAFGGVVRLESNSNFNTSGWFVAFGEPVDCWYDSSGNRAPNGTGTREVGVILRTLPYWNNVPWQLVVSPDICPKDQELEDLMNSAPTDPDSPPDNPRYLMTKWYVGGITDQWLELPVTHRVDDPHFGLISCNSKSKKIWVAIKTGLNRLNTYNEKTRWFKNPLEVVSVPYAYQNIGKVIVGFNGVVKNNYLFPSDEIIESTFRYPFIWSNIRSQFATEGARFCKIQLIEIDINNDGTLSINNTQIRRYEDISQFPENNDNWKHEYMTSYLSHIGSDYENKIFNTSGENGLEVSGQIVSSHKLKSNPFLSAMVSFFKEGIISHAYPSMPQSARNLAYWNNFKQILLSNLPAHKITSSWGIFAKIGSIIASNTEIKVESHLPFGPTHVMGLTPKAGLIDGIGSDSIQNNEDIRNSIIYMTEVFFRRVGEVVNCFDKMNNEKSLYWPFWSKERLAKLLTGQLLSDDNESTSEHEQSTIKSLDFFTKKGLQNEPHSSYYKRCLLFANYDNNSICVFDFMRGFKKEEFQPPLFNELALATSPIDCPVYVCKITEDGELADYNIYSGKIATARIHPLKYTDGEPCSFTIWGAAPVLMAIKK